MPYHSDVRLARIAAEKLLNTAPTKAAFTDHARNNALEVKIGELKRIVNDINAAGGLVDAGAAAALANLVANL